MTTPSSGRSTADRNSIADGALARLSPEFRGELPHRVVASTVLQSFDSLVASGAPAGALPELVERLARQRLLDRCGRSGTR